MPSIFDQTMTPEINQDYLQSLLAPISEQEQSDEAQARNEGASMGLIGQASTGARIAGAKANAGRQRTDVISRFNMDLANKKYGERMHLQDQAFQDTERQKQEEFQKQMTELGYQYDIKTREAENRRQKIGGYQGVLTGMALKAGGAIVGGLIGGSFGAPGLGASIGSGIGGGGGGYFGGGGEGGPTYGKIPGGGGYGMRYAGEIGSGDTADYGPSANF